MAVIPHIEGPDVAAEAACEQVLRSVPNTPTRAFYERMGFVALEVFPELWSPSNPCLQMLKVLA